MGQKSIGAFIAALRKANGLTQKDLAEKLNVSDKTISRWEKHRLQQKYGVRLCIILAIIFFVQIGINNVADETTFASGTVFEDYDSFVAYMEEESVLCWINTAFVAAYLSAIIITVIIYRKKEKHKLHTTQTNTGIFRISDTTKRPYQIDLFHSIW